MKKPSSKPLQREGNLSDRIYNELRLRLLKNPLAPNERLVDLEVAQFFGTSRMPARDALLRLVNEGFLLGSTRGFVAPTLSLDDIREVFEVRRMLEPAAIASMVDNIDNATATSLLSALERARRALADSDGNEMVLANMEFRSAWLGRVKNKRLSATIARFVEHVQAVRLSTLNDPETRRIVMDGQEQLYQALMQHDGVKVHELMTRFILAAEKAFFDAHSATIDSEKTPADDLPSARQA